MLIKPVIFAGDMNVCHKEIDIYRSEGKDNCPSFTPEERNNF